MFREALHQMSLDLEDQLRLMPEVKEVFSSYTLANPELQVVPDRERLADLGMNTADVADTVESSDCVVMVGTYLTDINFGLFSAQLEPAHTISITAEQIAIKHHHYGQIQFVDFLTALCQNPNLPHQDPSAILAMTSRVTPSWGSLSMSGLISGSPVSGS